MMIENAARASEPVETTTKRELETFHALLAEVKDQVDRDLEESFASMLARAETYGSATHASVRVLRDLTMRGGKRFRPALTTAAYLATGGTDTRDVIKAGVALELLQSYFLIHDDWMDGDDTRRGGPSAHAALASELNSAQAGAVGAILVGDLAVSEAQVAFASLARVAPDALAEATRVFARTQVDVVFGQLLDVYAVAATRADVERTHLLKTASYTVRGPVLIGATLARASDPVKHAFEKYGTSLGIAFQLRDDVLGVFGDPRATGKPVGADIRAGKKTSLIIELLELDPAIRPLLERTLGVQGASDEDLAEVVARMERSGARARVEHHIERLLAESRAALDAVSLHERGAKALRGAIEAVGKRSR